MSARPLTMLRPPDRAVRSSILLSTRVLPRALRVPLRRDLLARLEMARARRADLLVVNHPKCGTTWFRVMISRLYQHRYGIPGSIVAKSDELARRHPAIPHILSTNGHYSYERVVGDALDADGPRTDLHEKRVVLLVRNPCDIVVSWYFQFTKRQSAYKNELINADLARPVERERVDMWDFVKNDELGLPHLIEFFNRWERNLARVEHSIVVRYEELRVDPLPSLRRVGALIGEEFSEEELAEARDFGSFENLRKLESEGYFRYGGLTLRNANDPETFKVRRGKVGGYRDYFDEDQVAEMEAMVATRLSPSLGYSGE